jgi:hypothetical protein
MDPSINAPSTGWHLVSETGVKWGQQWGEEAIYVEK